MFDLGSSLTLVVPDPGSEKFRFGFVFRPNFDTTQDPGKKTKRIPDPDPKKGKSGKSEKFVKKRSFSMHFVFRLLNYYFSTNTGSH